VQKPIRTYFEPGLPKTPDPDPNLTGLFLGFFDLISPILAIIAPFALNAVFARFKTGLFKPVSIDDLLAGLYRTTGLWKNPCFDHIDLPGSGEILDGVSDNLCREWGQPENGGIRSNRYRPALSDGSPRSPTWKRGGFSQSGCTKRRIPVHRFLIRLIYRPFSRFLLKMTSKKFANGRFWRADRLPDGL